MFPAFVRETWQIDTERRERERGRVERKTGKKRGEGEERES